MSCLINAGLLRDCGFSFGGLSALYLVSKSAVVSVRHNSGGTITGITMSTGTTKFFAFEAEPNTSQLLQELQAGSASRFVNQTVNAQFANITQVKKEVLEALANAYVVAIAKDQAGKYWFAGESGRGLLATALSINTGAAEADAYVATISLVGGSLGYADEITSAAALAVI
jgi:hypothetical protein